MQQFDQAPVPDDIQAQVGTLSNLTTTEKSNLVGAVNEVKSTLSDQITALSETHSTKLVNATDATKTLVQRGIIANEGIYSITLVTQIQNTNNFSIYGFRYINSTYYVTPIFEGSNAQAPRISSNGVLGLNGYTPNNSVIWYSVQKLY